MPIIYATNETLDKLPERDVNDHYETPIEFVRAALKNLPFYNRLYRCLDPGAGSGVWGRGVKEYFPRCKVTGVEIREIERPAHYDVWRNEDFLSDRCLFDELFDLVVGNPPYGKQNGTLIPDLAEKFVRRSWALCKPGGSIYFLLPLDFISSAKRHNGLWRDIPLHELHVSANRIHFVGKGTANPNIHAMYHWYKGYSGPWHGKTFCYRV